MQIIEEKLKYI